MNLPCVSPGPAVFPADPAGKAFPCSSTVVSGLGAHPLGTRYWLDMTAEDIEALPVPYWKKIFVRALVNYGGFVGVAALASLTIGLLATRPARDVAALELQPQR